jgi:hypothetical protein
MTVFSTSTAIASLLGLAALPIGPAAALDLGVSLGAGGVSAEVGASVGPDGASANASAGVGDTASASAGVSTAPDSVKAGVAVDAGAASLNANLQAGAPPAPESQPPAAPGAPPAVESPPTVESPPATAESFVALPSSLSLQVPCPAGSPNQCQIGSPDDRSVDAITPEYLRALTALAVRRTAPQPTVTACREGIVQGALPYDAVRVDAVSAGAVQQVQGGGHIAPLIVRIVYDRQGGYEVREARIACQVDAGGAVVAFTG